MRFKLFMVVLVSGCVILIGWLIASTPKIRRNARNHAIDQVRVVCGPEEARKFAVIAQGHGTSAYDMAQDWMIHRAACGGSR